MVDLQNFRQRLDQKQGKRDLLQSQLSGLGKRARELKRQVAFSEQARGIIQTVGQQTQEELQYHISELVSLALNAVFDEPYTFKVEFVLRRGKTECDLLFERDGHAFSPIDSSGGGPVDVAAFALRIALWNIASPRPRNTLILDEPFKFIDPIENTEHLRRASDMLKELSAKLGLQLIYVTHSPDLAEAADKVFTVSQRRGISKVEEK